MGTAEFFEESDIRIGQYRAQRLDCCASIINVRSLFVFYLGQEVFENIIDTGLQVTRRFGSVVSLVKIDSMRSYGRLASPWPH